MNWKLEKDILCYLMRLLTAGYFVENRNIDWVISVSLCNAL
jgi:hypothetical protein